MKAYQPQMKFVRPAFTDGTPTRQISLGQESWERVYLGSEYVLSLAGPDTFVKFRDAVIQSDRILYPTDPSNLDAPGQHEALIWQVFASHEIGVNAARPGWGSSNDLHQGAAIRIRSSSRRCTARRNRRRGIDKVVARLMAAG